MTEMLRQEWGNMRRIAQIMAVAMLALAFAAPAFAAGSGGAGAEFGAHHAGHAQEMTGFTGSENPGVMHTGFAGWTGR